MRKRLRNHFIPHDGNDYKPIFVRERNLIGIGLLVVAIFGLAFSVKSLVTKNPDLLSAVLTAVLVDLTNTNRLTEKLNPLEFSPVLASAAQLKANDMAEKSYFAHTSPDGKNPWYWFTQSGYSFLYAGENLAVNFVDSEDVVRAWMNSEGHRANILNDKFSEIGIAMASGVYNGRESIYVVQLFAKPVPLAQVRASVVIVKENIEVVAEDKMFIAVKNNSAEEVAGIESVNEEVLAQTSVVDKVIASPKMALEAIYLAIGGIVLLAFLLFIWLKPKHMHTKNVVYTLLLLVLISVLLYLSTAYLFPQILVE